MSKRMLDSLLPAEMSKKAEEVGISKAKMSVTKTFTLTGLAGVFISFGAIFSTTATEGSNIYFGITKFFGGFVFSLGLILVVVGGEALVGLV